MDLAELNLVVRSTQVADANRRLDVFVHASARAEASARAFGRTAEGAARDIGRLDGALRGFVTRLAAVSAAYAGFSGFRSVVDEALEFEQALIAVGKTTDLTDAQLGAFGDRLRLLSTEIPVSAERLARLAEAAGQMGVRGASNLEAFAETLGRLELSSNLVGDSGARALGRLLNVTGQAADQIGTLGSVITALGNNLSATESEIVTVSEEVGRATAQYGLLAEEVAAIAGAFAAVGIRPELARGVTGRLFLDLTDAVALGGSELEKFMGLTRMTREELDKNLRDAPFEVFVELMQGLRGAYEQGQSLNNILRNIGAEGQRDMPTLSQLASAYQVLGRSIEVARQEMENPTALMRESERAASSLSARLKILGNTIFAAFDALDQFPALKNFTDDLTGAVAVIGRLEGAAEEATPEIHKLASAIEATGAALAVLAGANIARGLARVPGLLAGVAAGLGPIGVAAVAATAAVVYFKDEMVNIGPREVAFGDLFIATFEEVLERSKEFWRSLISDLGVSLEHAADDFAKFLTDIDRMWAKLFGADLISSVRQFVNDLYSVFLAVRDNLGRLGDFFKAVWDDFLNPFGGGASPDHKWREFVIGLADSFNQYFGAAPGKGPDLFKDIGLAGRDAGREYAANFKAGLLELWGDGEPGSLGDEINARVFARQIERGDMVPIVLGGRFTSIVPTSSFPRTAEPGGPGFSLPPAPEVPDGLDILVDKRNRRDRVRDIFRELEIEERLVGHVGEARERAAKVLELENALIEQYGKNLSNINPILAEYEERLKGLERVERLRDAAEDIGDAFADGFERAVYEAENFRDAMLSIADEIQRALFRAFVTVPIQQAATSGAFNLLTNLFSRFDTGTFAGGAFAPGGSQFVGPMMPFAHGAAFPHPIYPNARGNVYDRPFTFPMSGGIGVGAEHFRPEGIVPLRRMPNGDLGIQASGAGGQSITNNYEVNVTVRANNPDEFRGASLHMAQDLRRGLARATLRG